jgi:hypothetical protein
LTDSLCISEIMRRRWVFPRMEEFDIIHFTQNHWGDNCGIDTNSRKILEGIGTQLIWISWAFMNIMQLKHTTVYIPWCFSPVCLYYFVTSGCLQLMWTHPQFMSLSSSIVCTKS